uniref:Uncharacterized protein n=1 Tax=Amphimedon queenslandica TaxID=400682 RepID=A0A1X7UQ02_AMPQE
MYYYLRVPVVLAGNPSRHFNLVDFISLYATCF